MPLVMGRRINLRALPSLPLGERWHFPHQAAVYFVLATWRKVLYIGATRSLFMRWRNHHLLPQFKALSSLHVAWLLISRERRALDNILALAAFLHVKLWDYEAMFNNPEMVALFPDFAANRAAIHEMEQESWRLDLESALIDYYQPPYQRRR
jgi:hypothetical protein